MRLRLAENEEQFKNKLRLRLKKLKMFLIETLLNLVKSLGNKKIDLWNLWARTAREDKRQSGQ